MSTDTPSYPPSPAIDESIVDTLEVDWLILADWAAAIEGKFYIQGGGWDRIVAPRENLPLSFAFAAGILVPWNLTNREHRFVLSFETGDGKELAMMEGGFNVGRPVTAHPVQKSRIPLAGQISMPSPGLGQYLAKLTLNGEITKSAAFYVVKAL